MVLVSLPLKWQWSTWSIINAVSIWVSWEISFWLVIFLLLVWAQIILRSKVVIIIVRDQIARLKFKHREGWSCWFMCIGDSSSWCVGQIKCGLGIDKVLKGNGWWLQRTLQLHGAMMLYFAIWNFAPLLLLSTRWLYSYTCWSLLLRRMTHYRTSHCFLDPCFDMRTEPLKIEKSSFLCEISLFILPFLLNL